MEYISLDEVGTLESTFDVFTESEPVERELLASRLTPPLIRRGRELVWGYAIVSEARRNNIESLPVVVKDATDAESFVFMLLLEARTDRYSYEEKLRLQDLYSRFDIEAIAPEVIPSILSLVQRSGSFIDQATKFRLLTPVRRRLVESGRIELKHAGRLNRLPDGVWEQLEIREEFSRSEMRLVSTYLEEIARRDELDDADCIKMVREVCAIPDALSTLRKLRFPQLSAMENTFETLHERVLAKSGVKLVAPESFEGDSYELSFRFRSPGELDQRIRAVERVKGICDELFSLL